MSNKFVPAVQHFGFYEDGTESGAVIIGSEDTNITRDNTSDSDLHLRLMIEEVGGGSISGLATDDWGIQYQVNAGGSWTTVTATSSRCRTDTASDLTDNGATTDRLTGGSGSFFAGIQEEGDGEVTDFLHQADNWTNHVWALSLIAADNADGDTLDFRLIRNGGTSTIDQNITPRITISKTTTVPLAADIATGGTVDADLTGTFALAAAATGTAAVAADLTLNKAALEAAVVGSAVVDADLRIVKSLEATASGTGAVAADLTLNKATLAAAVAASATIDADLTLNVAALEAALTGTASVDADLRIIKPLEASLNGTATLDAALSMTAALAAAISTSAAVDADLTVTPSGGPGVTVRLLRANRRTGRG